MSEEKDVKKEQITRVCVEMDPTTKEWVNDLKDKYGCKTHRELYFLALKFLSETPDDRVPFEVFGVLERRKIVEIPRDIASLRWLNIKRLQSEINQFVVRTAKDKETLVKMQSELRKLLKDQATDEASKLLRELRAMKEKMERPR